MLPTNTGASGDRHPASATDGAFELDLLQPAAVAAARRAEAGLREGAGGYKPRGSAPPGLSPLAASNVRVNHLNRVHQRLPCRACPIGLVVSFLPGGGAFPSEEENIRLFFSPANAPVNVGVSESLDGFSSWV